MAVEETRAPLALRIDPIKSSGILSEYPGYQRAT